MDENINPRGAAPKKQKLSSSKLKRIRAARIQITSYLERLNSIYDTVEAIDAAFLDLSADDQQLSTKCEELKLTDDGRYEQALHPCFFDVSSLDVCHHPLNPNRRVNCRDKDEGLTLWIERVTSGQLPAVKTGTGLCYHLDWEFDSYPRLGTEDNASDFCSLSQWRLSGDLKEDFVFDPIFWDPLILSSNPSWKSISAYVHTSESPHIMLSIQHEIMVQESLLQREALSILTTMITRLRLFGRTGHYYLPVLVFSFMGNLRGRILQSYYDGENLVIRKTSLYHLEPEDKARDHFRVFLQQMTCLPSAKRKTKKRNYNLDESWIRVACGNPRLHHLGGR